MKKFKQLSTYLKGQTTLAPKQFFEIAEKTARQCSQDEAQGIVLEKNVALEGEPVTQRYAIRHDGQPINALEIWIDTTGGKLPAKSKPVAFYADWAR